MDSIPEVVVVGEMHKAQMLMWLTAAAFPHPNLNHSAIWSCFPPSSILGTGSTVQPQGLCQAMAGTDSSHTWDRNRGTLRRRESS